MKKRESTIYEENSNVWDDYTLPAANILSPLLETTVVCTYPTSILARRVNLLTEHERHRCDALWKKIVKNATQIDDIISNRAEILNDPW